MRGRPALLLLPLLLIAFSASAQDVGELQKLIIDLQSQNWNDQVKTAHSLGEMGSDAERAIPALVRVIKTGRAEVRVISLIALLKIDPTMRDMVPILLYSVEGEGQAQEPVLEQELGLQQDAFWKWGSLVRTKVDPSILPLLVDALRESDADIRTLAVLLLGNLARESSEALRYVLEASKDPDKQVRGAVLRVLSRIGPRLEEVIPALLAGLKDSEPEVRTYAVIALGRLGAKTKKVIPALTRALSDEESQVRFVALKVLESFGAEAKEAAPAEIGRASCRERVCQYV